MGYVKAERKLPYQEVYSLPSQEIAVQGEAPHRYFLVLYVYFFGGKDFDSRATTGFKYFF
jgi:hypothetical protein